LRALPIPIPAPPPTSIPAPPPLILDPTAAISAAADLESAFVNTSAGFEEPPAQVDDEGDNDDMLGGEEVVFDPGKSSVVSLLEFNSNSSFRKAT